MAKGNLKPKTGKSGKREFKKLKREKVAKGNLKPKTGKSGKREFKSQNGKFAQKGI